MSGQRLTATQARELLIAEGQRLLRDRGSRTDPVGIDLAEVIANSPVPRSSAYNAFQHETLSPQDAFNEALTESLINTSTHGDVDAVAAAAIELVAAEPDIFDTGTPLELAQFLRRVIRKVVRANLDAFEQSELVWIHVAILAEVRQSDDPPNHRLTPALRDQDRTIAMVALYRDLADGFGLRLKAGWTWENFDAAMSAIMLGTAARAGIVESLEGIMRTTGPDGQPEAWSASAAIVEGLILTAFEPNPRVTNAADLQSWLQ